MSCKKFNNNVEHVEIDFDVDFVCQKNNVEYQKINRIRRMINIASTKIFRE